MCGILGWVSATEKMKPFSYELIRDTFDVCEFRGTDATGFYSPATGVCKYPGGAKNIIPRHKELLEKALSSDLFIGHCRAASSGAASPAPPSRNENNHPFEGERYVLVHNGHFALTPRVKDYPYKGTCDSEIMLSLVETFGPEKAIQLASKHDSFAIVFYDKVDDILYLYRSANPLVIGYDLDHNALIYASTTEIVDFMTESIEHGGMVFSHALVYQEINSETLYSIKPKVGLMEKKVVAPRASDSVFEKILSADERGKLDLAGLYPARNIVREYRRDDNIRVIGGMSPSRDTVKCRVWAVSTDSGMRYLVPFGSFTSQKPHYAQPEKIKTIIEYPTPNLHAFGAN